MEARFVLDASVFITEFAADGRASIPDRQGDHNDWIEIHNSGAEVANLEGWYLTDDALDLRKWRFPAVELPPQGYLVVFASGKDQTTSATALHTNFKLSDDGEYLALIHPDGVTVQSEFSPTYPAQLPGASFGLAQQELSETLVAQNSSYRYYVPPPEATVDRTTDWAGAEFDDSAWSEGQGALGFDQTGTLLNLIETDIGSVMWEKNSTAYLRTYFEVPSQADWAWIRFQLRYDAGYIIYVNGERVASENASTLPTSRSRAVKERLDPPASIQTLLLRTDELPLREGQNVLAVHGMNSVRSEEDFLIEFEVSAVRPGAVAPDDAGSFFYPPSPGYVNGVNGVEGQVAEVQASLPRGFYNAPQQLELTTATPGATIVYTTDGTLPTLYNGIATVPNSEELTPRVTIELASTTTLRVAAFKSEFVPTPATTYTYIFLSDVLTQSADGAPAPGWPNFNVNGQKFDYGMDPDVVNDPEYGPQLVEALTDLPSISLVTEPQHLFDSATGIYVNADTARADESLWERPASIELIHPDGQEGFQIDAGLRIRGGYSRNDANPKHAFRVLFRSMYGAAELEYPLFGEEGADTFEKIDLRTSQVPSWSFCIPEHIPYCVEHTMVRDVFARDTQRDMGQPYTRSRYYHLYLNGQYWGLYQSQERADGAHGERYLGGDEDDYDVIKVESQQYDAVATHGTLNAWRDLWDAAKAGFTDNADYYRVQGLNPDGTPNPDLPVLLDVDNLIDYVLTIFYTGDLDAAISWFGDNLMPNNWFGIRNRNAREGFQFFVHDAEWGLFDVNENRLGPWPAGDQFVDSNPQWLHQQLVANEEYRLRFADRVQRHLFNGGALSPESALARVQARIDQIDKAIIAESARWGDASGTTLHTKEHWLTALRHITDVYIPQRREILIEQLRNAQLAVPLSGTAPLVMPVEAPTLSPHGGVFDQTLEVQMLAEGDIFFTVDGTDPREHAPVVEWTPVVGSNSELQYYVPTDAALQDRWSTADLDSTSWNTATGGIGFGNLPAGPGDVVFQDVEQEMRNINSSVYVRIPFELPVAMTTDTIRLKLAVDDGFVAFLNGVRITQDKAPEQLAWNSRATLPASSLNITFDRVLGEHTHVLRPGENVLAIQGLNRTPSSTDFLLAPEFFVGKVVHPGTSASATLYTEPITLYDATQIQARTYQQGQWSALSEAEYVGPPLPVRIDEIMYHPSSPTAGERAAGFLDDNDFEYVELLNISDVSTVNLAGVTLSDGLEYVLPEVFLGPGERAVVVRNQAAFAYRYGTEFRVVGQFGFEDGGNKLSNEGESLELRDRFGVLLHRIVYDDRWFPQTDGVGASLQAIDARSFTPLHESTARDWRPSASLAGTPGQPPRLVGDVNADGLFDTSDLVQLLMHGEYEDGIPGNSTFDEGDWNGDGEFDVADLVLALQLGHYEKPAVAREPVRAAGVVDRIFAVNQTPHT